ncbi:MAG: hypothetical protein CMH57_00080 [Myxococcales bacterium]|nr:hypothetical protein [Myxococcales bacterium]
MRVPVIALSDVALPGVPGDLEVERELAEALHTFGELEGFGCLEVLLASPRDPSHPPSATNLAPLGALVELLFPPEALNTDAPRVRLEVGEGHRVELVSPAAVTEVYGTPWEGILAGFESRKPRVSGLTEEGWAGLRRALYRRALSQPGDAAGPFAPPLGLLEAVAGPVLEIERLQAPDWKVAYIAADRVLTDPAERYQMLERDDAGEACEALGLVGRLQEGADEGEALESYSEVLEEVLSEKLSQARLAVEALAWMARQEVVELPGGTSRTLREMDRDFEQLMATLEGIVAQIDQRRPS